MQTPRYMDCISEAFLKKPVILMRRLCVIKTLRCTAVLKQPEVSFISTRRYSVRIIPEIR